MSRLFLKNSFSNIEHFSIFTHLLKWTLLCIPVAVSVGSVVALFLWSLDKVTEIRETNSWLLFLLPLSGIFILYLYKKFGKNSDAGNNLIMEEIHVPGGGVPLRMTPLILFTTIITHLFGGSAGREGTAVQMGGSLAGRIGRLLSLSGEDNKIMLMVGISSGFGAVFGTPIAGAIFALEVLTIGKINHRALLPVFIGSYFADVVCSAWGITHTHYKIKAISNFTSSKFFFLNVDILLLLKVIFAGVCFGLVGYIFSELSHQIKYVTKKISNPWLVPVLGGVTIISLTYLLGSRDYLGIGVSGNGSRVNIVSAFQLGGSDLMSWFWKLLFTAITLGTGFKGGEVTPLFFIGATLGNTLAVLLGAPVDLMAGLGFVAVFAGATNTPIACMIMGVELFGGEHIVYLAIACFTAYYFSGHSGIYQAQRLGVSKNGKAKLIENEPLSKYAKERTERISKWLKRK